MIKFAFGLELIFLLIFFANTPAFAQELSKEELINLEIEKAVKDFEPEELPVSLEARYFSLGADANLNTSSVNLGGNNINLKKDLKLINDHAPEIIFRYKNFSLDYLRMSKVGGGNFSAENPLTFGGQNVSSEVSAKNSLHYIRLNVDNEIISLMGTGAYWTYGLTGIYWSGDPRADCRIGYLYGDYAENENIHSIFRNVYGRSRTFK